MYVCNCSGVTDSAIVAAADQGCTSLRDLRLELGVAANCGKCAKQACALLKARQCTVRAVQPVFSHMLPA